MDNGLNDAGWKVRLAWVRRTGWTPTPEQVEIMLNDSHYDVRETWVRRANFIPTTEQIDAGLRDRSESGRNACMDKLRSGMEGELAEDTQTNLEVSL